MIYAFVRCLFALTTSIQAEEINSKKFPNDEATFLKLHVTKLYEYITDKKTRELNKIPDADPAIETCFMSRFALLVFGFLNVNRPYIDGREGNFPKSHRLQSIEGRAQDHPVPLHTSYIP